MISGVLGSETLDDKWNETVETELIQIQGCILLP